MEFNIRFVGFKLAVFRAPDARFNRSLMLEIAGVFHITVNAIALPENPLVFLPISYSRKDARNKCRPILEKHQ